MRRRGGIISMPPKVTVSVDVETPQQDRLKYERKNTLERENADRHIKNASIQNVVDRIESKYPFVRKFGDKDFEVDSHIKELL